MDLVVLPFVQLLAEELDNHSFDAALVQVSGLEGDPDPFRFWHSSQTAPGQLNYGGWSNPYADGLMERSRIELDAEERRYLLHRFRMSSWPTCRLCPSARRSMPTACTDASATSRSASSTAQRTTGHFCELVHRDHARDDRGRCGRLSALIGPGAGTQPRHPCLRYNDICAACGKHVLCSRFPIRPDKAQEKSMSIHSRLALQPF